MTHPRPKGDRHYASRAKMRGFVEEARALGIKVGGVELGADGTIRILADQPGRAISADAAYDDWKNAGN
jgi:hypothetical protein